MGVKQHVKWINLAQDRAKAMESLYQPSDFVLTRTSCVVELMTVAYPRF